MSLDNNEPEIKTLDKEGSRYRQYSSPWNILIKVVSAGGALFFILYLSGVFAQFGVYFLYNEYNAFFMSLVLTLTFLLVPAGRMGRTDRLPWYDILLILGSLSGSIYVSVNALELTYFGKLSATPVEVALGCITMLALMEAVRRSFGWGMIGVVVAFLLYARFGYLVSGSLRVYPLDWSHLIADIYLSTQGIYGPLTSLSSTIVFAFITFGVFFIAAGGGKFFLDSAFGLTGSMRGGPAKVAVVGSALFATVSGSSVSNVVVTGTITIPMMKSTGYKEHYAGAIECVASVGGSMTPPIMGGTAFILAEMVNTTYRSIAIMAAIPAFLYYLSLFIQIDLRAAKEGLGGLLRQQLPSLKKTIREGWELLIPLLTLLVLLFVLRYTAVVSALYTIVSLIVVSMFRERHRINAKKFVDILYEGVRNVMPVANIIALAGVILALVNVTGLGPRLSAGLVALSGNSLLLLVLMSAIASYIIGMGISPIAGYVLVASLVAPAMVRFGLPLIVAHFFIWFIVHSALFTPPYCPTAYVAAGIAKAHPFRVAFTAMRLGIVVFLIPIIIVYNQALLLIGTPGEIALATVSAIIGVSSLAVGLEGYLLSRLNWLQRLLFIGGGTLLLAPGMVTDLCGVVLLVLVILRQWRSYMAKRRCI